MIGNNVKATWLNIRVCAVLVLLAMGAIALIPVGGVREIHEADRISNFALVDPSPHSDDWPWWRGTDGRNVTTSDQFPKQWPEGNDNGWRITVPGYGSATPSLWGDQLFLLTSETDAQRISLRSYRRATGRENWLTVLHQGGRQELSGKKSHASSTPACDGQFVYAVSAVRGQLWISSVDMTGRIVWQREVGAYSSRASYGSSPALFKSLVFVLSDQKKDGYLAALHRQTGDTVWRIKRPDGESCGSPVVATLAGRPQLIVGGKGAISSYDPATGDSLWNFRWAAERVANTVAFDDERVFATSQQPQAEVVCIKADGLGDVTDSHLVWRQSKIGGEIPSPVYHAGLLYVLADDGLLRCLDAATGKIEWRRRLEGNFSASPVIAGELLICSSEAGLTYLLQTGLSNAVVAENPLPDGIMATPIVAGDSIFIRTASSLYRLAPPTSEPIVEKPDRHQRRL